VGSNPASGSNRDRNRDNLSRFSNLSDPRWKSRHARVA
jgi:hypothetical protein